jgi:hypothetical protein
MNILNFWKKGGTPNFSVRFGPDWVQNGADYDVYTMRFLKHPKLLVYDEKLEAPRSLYSSPGYNNNISQ